MSMVDEMSLRRRQTLLGQTKKLLDEGCSIALICEELNLSESTARSLVATCEEAEANRNKMTDNTIE